MRNKKMECIPLSCNDVEYLLNLIDNAKWSEKQANLLMRFEALHKHFQKQKQIETQKKRKEKRKEKTVQKKVIRPCTKHEWRTPIYVFQLEIRGTGEDAWQPGIIHFVGADRPLRDH